jgi:hypothetical protein
MLVFRTDSNCHPGSFAKLEAKNNSKEICGHGRMPRSADLELGLSTGGGAGGLGDGENEFSDALQSTSRTFKLIYGITIHFVLFFVLFLYFIFCET